MTEQRTTTPSASTNDATNVWGMPLNVFYCANCHSAHLAPINITLAMCPSCLQGTLTTQPEQMRRERPELLIHFAVGAERAQALLAEWSKGVWFRPAELKADLLRQRLRRYFFPLWLVDSDIAATWQAEMGYNYQAASFREQYQSGQWISQEITETRARWEPRTGRLERHYDNVTVPAMEEHEKWMSRLGRYDFLTRTPYSPPAIAESVVRVPDHAPDAAWMNAESALNHAAAFDCQAASGADHIRNWGMRAEYKNLNWTQLLVPAYVTWYREGNDIYPVWINGQSGQIYGVKVMAMQTAWIVAAIIAVLAALCFLLGLILTAVVGIGIVLILLSLLIGMAAPIPLIWVWIHNRNARREAGIAVRQ